MNAHNEVQPSRIPQPDRILVIGDVHGDVQRLILCLISTKILSPALEWIAEPKNTIVIQLGDQIDSASRGGDPSWENTVDLDVLYMTEKLDALASVHGGRFISLIGNHEIMNCVGQFTYVSQKSFSVVDVNERRSLFIPGKGDCCRILAKRNVVVQIGKYLFCHGGLLPKHLDILEGDFDKANVLVQKIMRGESLNELDRFMLNSSIMTDDGIIWMRSLYYLIDGNDDIVEKIMDSVLHKTNAICMFVGHNTVDNIRSAGNNKIFFVDAALSRAYPYKRIQVVEIRTTGDKDHVNIIEIKNA